MGKAIIKIKDKLFLWSTIVDAPVTYGLTPEEMEEVFIEDAVEKAKQDFKSSMKSVDQKGHAFNPFPGKNTVKDIVSLNRAGPDETRLTMEEIYEAYAEPPDDDEEEEDS